MSEAAGMPPSVVRRSITSVPGSSPRRPDIRYGELRRTVMQSILAKSAIKGLADQNLKPSIDKKSGTFYSWPADMQQAETAGCLLPTKNFKVPKELQTEEKGTLVFMFHGFAVKSRGLWVRTTEGSDPTEMDVPRDVANALKATVTEKAGEIKPMVTIPVFSYRLQPPGGQEELDALVQSGDAVPSPFVSSNPAAIPEDIQHFYNLIVPEKKRRPEIVAALADLVAVHEAMGLG